MKPKTEHLSHGQMWAEFQLLNLYFSSSAQVLTARKVLCLRFHEQVAAICTVAGVISSKALFEIVNQLVCFEITEKDWVFIAFDTEVCLFLSTCSDLFRTGARWLFEICFPTLSFSWYSTGG